MAHPTDTADAPLISIGGLARATGIAVETLRTWERRYGYPEATRTASGHRRYTLETALRLRLVHRALQQGHRASAVVPCPQAALEALLGLSAAPTSPPLAADAQVGAWLDRVRRFEADALEQGLSEAWTRFGPERFVLELALPFLRALGDGWAQGDLGVAHEHFASERLRDFVAQQWRGLSRRNQGPSVVLAALSGEQHTLILHLAAVVLARLGLRPLILGADTPGAEVARAARDASARAVIVTGSRTTHQIEELCALRRALPAAVDLAVGGHAQGVPEGVQHLPRLEALSGWAAELAAGA